MLNPSAVLMDFHISIFPLLCVMLLLGIFSSDLLQVSGADSQLSEKPKSVWQSLTAPFSSSWYAFQNSLSNCLLADTLPQGIGKVLLWRMNKIWVRRSSYKWLIFAMERY